MKSGHVLIGVVCALLILSSGCSHLQPVARVFGAKPKPAVVKATPTNTVTSAKDEKREAKDRAAQLDRTIAEQRKVQDKLNKELADLEHKLADTQAQLQQLERREKESRRKLSDSETVLASLGGSSGSLQAVSQPPGTAFRGVSTVTADSGMNASSPVRTAASSKAHSFSTMSSGSVGSVESDSIQKLPDPVAGVAGGASEMSGLSASQLVVEGNKQLRDGKLADAEKLFGEAAVKDPSMMSSKFGIASCRYTAGDLPEAKRLVEEVLQVEPKNSQAMGLSGIIAWRQGDLKTATHKLQSAIKLSSGDAQLHNYMGIIWYAQDKRSQAIKELQKAIELNPNIAEARFNLAIILATDDTPQLAEARQNYQTALRLGSARDEKLEKILYQ